MRVEKKDFHWVEEEKEIRIDGRMFDVESWHFENGAYIVTGLFDDEETALFRQMEKTREDENANGNTILADFFQFEGTNDHHSEGVLSFVTIDRQYAWYATAISHKHIAIITPPPRC